MSETLFKQVTYTLSGLIQDIEMGTIGLPDIQRPFVWKNAKVRNLFDSMYQGYPIGYLLLWENSVNPAKAIGVDRKQKSASLLIVDGQQRLTSLYAVIKGIPVVRENYEPELIQIAFDPRQEKFEVADAAVRKDKAYLPNISSIWKQGQLQTVREYLAGLREIQEISPDEERRIEDAITKLHSLLTYPLTALELSVQLSEEQVAEVFVRINSEGKPLNQADFILTLMSVFWDEGRAELEAFSRAARQPASTGTSPYNHHFIPDPDQLLRVGVIVAFRRARLHHVYSLLRGKDLDTEVFSEDRREEQFERLKHAQMRVLNLQDWHDFHKVLMRAGYRSHRMISSQNAVLFTYALYLLGRTEFGVERTELRRVLARWFFMATLTGRYTSSPESTMEFDLARFRGVETAEGFVQVLDRVCDERLTEDFWAITLPNDLATAAARSPSLYAFLASLVIHDAHVLFSDRKVNELLDPSINPRRKALERHHLFPKRHLAKLGITETRRVNQIANQTLIEWGDNARISAKAPEQYVPVLSAALTPAELERQYYWHALPDGWEHMEYDVFLQRRRELMARVIRDAYRRLTEGASARAPSAPVSIGDLVKTGEGVEVEFKSTLRVNLHTGQPDPRMEMGVLRTITGFLNSMRGGTLLIGVADDGTAVGVEADTFPNEDKMHLHLVNLIRDRIGPQFMMYIHPRFEEYDDRRVLAVECRPARSPAFVKDGTHELLFVRSGAASLQLQGAQAQQFIKERF